MCKKIPIVFHNGSNYDYHFIIKELAEEFKQIGRKGEISKIISYKSRFIDSRRFMANLAEGIHKIRCKYRHGDKKYAASGIKCKDCECCLEYRCLCCNRNSPQKLMNTWKSNFLIHTNFLAMASINLFCFCKKVFSPMNTWITAKNLR